MWRRWQGGRTNEMKQEINRKRSVTRTVYIVDCWHGQLSSNVPQFHRIIYHHQSAILHFHPFLPLLNHFMSLTFSFHFVDFAIYFPLHPVTLFIFSSITSQSSSAISLHSFFTPSAALALVLFPLFPSLLTSLLHFHLSFAAFYVLSLFFSP